MTFLEFRQAISADKLSNLVMRHDLFCAEAIAQLGRPARSKYSDESLESFVEWLYVLYRRQARKTGFTPESYEDAMAAIENAPQQTFHYDDEDGTWEQDTE
jgi:hypothetical protein